MRFSLLTVQGMDFCLRLRDLDYKCKYGEHPEWADHIVCLDGRPGDTPGVNNGLIAQAIYSDPTYIPHFTNTLPDTDSVLLVSNGEITGSFLLKEQNRIVPLGLGVEVSGAVTTLSWESPAGLYFPQIASGFKGVLRIGDGGKTVKLESSPGVWSALAEVYSLEKLFALPPHVMTPKLPLACSFAVASGAKPELPEAAIRHTLLTNELLYVSARGVTKKECYRRIERAIKKLDLENPIYRLDILKRR